MDPGLCDGMCRTCAKNRKSKWTTSTSNSCLRWWISQGARKGNSSDWFFYGDGCECYVGWANIKGWPKCILVALSSFDLFATRSFRAFTPPIGFATFHFALCVLAFSTRYNTREPIFAPPSDVCLCSTVSDARENDCNTWAETNKS